MVTNQIHALIRAYKILVTQQVTKIAELNAQKPILRQRIQDRCNSLVERDAFSDLLADLRRAKETQSKYIQFIAELENLFNFL